MTCIVGATQPIGDDYIRMKEKHRSIDDELNADRDIQLNYYAEFIHKLKQIFEVEKRIKEDEVQKSMKERCNFPIWFTYDEIIEILDKTHKKIKNREI